VENDWMIKALLATDDPRIAETVNRVAQNCCPHVSLVSTSDGVTAGVGEINRHEPDLVLVDTRLKDGSGFDLVRHFDKPFFKIIFFATSIDYAVKAIKFNAVDYLLKPIDDEELTLAINKAADLIRFEENLQQKALGKSITDLQQAQRLVLKTSDQVHVINIADIIRIEADSNYSTFYLQDGRRIVVTKAIKEYEELLLEHGFHRIHKSHIFNINKMSHLDKADGGYVVMVDGSKVPVASRKREMLLELFEVIK